MKLKLLYSFLLSLIFCYSSHSQDERPRIGKIELAQYALNSLNNPYDIPLEIVGIVSIPAYSTGTFETGGQDSVEIKVGSQSKKIKLIPNKEPIIVIRQLVNMDENSSYTELSGKVGYRFSVIDDFPGQLDIKIKGPVTLENSAKNSYDLILNAFNDVNQFENYAKDNSSPYTLQFSITITDQIAGHKITGQYNFIFGKY